MMNFLKQFLPMPKLYKIIVRYERSQDWFKYQSELSDLIDRFVLRINSRDVEIDKLIDANAADYNVIKAAGKLKQGAWGD